MNVADPQRKPETTALSSLQERLFREWAKDRGVNDIDVAPYDYRGAFLAGVEPTVSSVDNKPHWPDTFKQHGHPTFSVESMYSRGPRDGGSWSGEVFFPALSKNVTPDVTTAKRPTTRLEPLRQQTIGPAPVGRRMPTDKAVKESVLRDFMQRIGGSPNDILDAAVSMTTGPVGRAGKTFEAWHGSPIKDLTKFDLDKVVRERHGFGINVATDPKYAKRYRPSPLAVADLVGDSPNLAAIQKAVRTVQRAEGNIPSALAELRYLAQESNDPTLRGAIEQILTRHVRAEPRGALYRLQVEADPRELVDVAQPLSQQPRAQGVFRELGVEMQRPEAVGQDAYELLKQRLGSGRQASAALNTRGIPGMSYPSPVYGTGKNAVIFDPDRLRILETLGLAGMAGAAAPER